MKDQKSLEIAVVEDAGYSTAKSDLNEKAKEAFDSLGEILTDAIEPLRRKLDSAASSADEVEIALNLAFKTGGKWVVVSMEGSATIAIKLTWKRSSPNV